MADERDTGPSGEQQAAAAIDPKPSAIAPRPVTQPPRPVSSAPRPSSAPTPPPVARPPGTPPPPPVRSLLPRSPAEPLAQLAPSALRAPVAAAPAIGSLRPPPPSSRTAQSPFGPNISSASSPISRSATPEAGRSQELLADLMSARRELTEKSSELRRLTSERDVLRTRLVRAEASLRQSYSALRAESALRVESVETHTATTAALSARVGELEAALARVGTEPRAAAPDDLQSIRGIGPAFARALTALGIDEVARVAELSSADIARVAPSLKVRPDRIEREDWVGQAVRLLEERRNPR